jgi:hypothetical protein
MNATLGDLGVVGGAKTDEERTTILYKFRPGLNGPLLLKEPELMLPEFLGMDSDAFRFWLVLS